MNLPMQESPAGTFQTDTHRRREDQDAILERHDPPELLLDESGIILRCSKSMERLFGYRVSEIAWQHISCLFPQLSEVTLTRQGRINPKLEYIAHCGHVFEGLDKRGNRVHTELKFICLQKDGACTLRVILSLWQTGLQHP